MSVLFTSFLFICLAAFEVGAEDCGPLQGGLRVENDVHRYAGHHLFEPAFMGKGRHETPEAEKVKDPGRDAAAQIDPAGGQDLETEVACLGSQDGNKYVKGKPADLAGPVRIACRLLGAVA